MKGKVEEIARESSRKGDDYLRVKIDGETYSIWNQDYFDVLHEGDTIQFDYKESGQWKNITEMDVIRIDLAESGTNDDYMLAKDKRIARMSCVKSAAYVMANLDMEPVLKGDQTLSLARTFEKYVYEEDLGQLEDSGLTDKNIESKEQ